MRKSKQLVLVLTALVSVIIGRHTEGKLMDTPVTIGSLTCHYPPTWQVAPKVQTPEIESVLLHNWHLQEPFLSVMIYVSNEDNFEVDDSHDDRVFESKGFLVTSHEYKILGQPLDLVFADKATELTPKYIQDNPTLVTAGYVRKIEEILYSVNILYDEEGWKKRQMEEISLQDKIQGLLDQFREDKP